MTRPKRIVGQVIIGLILSGPTLFFWYEAIWDSGTVLGDGLLYVTGALSPLMLVTSIVLAIIEPRRPELLIASVINGTPILALLGLIVFEFIL